MGRTDEAIQALEKALELNPDIIQAMCNLANAYLQKGDLEKSLVMNQKMLEQAPNFALGYNNLANVYYHLGKIDKAIEYCDKALSVGFEVHPDFLKLLDPHRKKVKKPSAIKSKTKQSMTKSKPQKKGKAKKSE